MKISMGYLPGHIEEYDVKEGITIEEAMKIANIAVKENYHIRIFRYDNNIEEKTVNENVKGIFVCQNIRPGYNG